MMKILTYYRQYRQRQRLRSCTYDNTPAFSLENYSGWVKIVRVIDGDTVHAAVSLHNHIYRWSCRLQGIDCPELRSKNPREQDLAQQAKAYLEQLIGQNLVWAVFGKPDKYGRPLVELSTRPGSPTFSSLLLNQDLAHPYNGKGAKPAWT